MTLVSPTPVPLEQGEDQTEDFVNAFRTIFDSSENIITLRDGTEVEVYEARMKHVPVLIEMFTDIVSSVDQRKFIDLIDMMVNYQKAAAGQGFDPRVLNPDNKSVEDLVRDVFGGGSVLMQIVTAIFHKLPRFAGAFTNLDVDEFDAKIDLDEAILIVGAILHRNYHFFTRRLPPLLTAFMQSWASKNATALVAEKPKSKTRKTK